MDTRVESSDVFRVWQIDTETVPEANAMEMLRHAELRHEALFRAALGLDQRAAVIGAAFVTVAAALSAGAMAAPAEVPTALRWAFAAAAATFSIGALLCFWSARPSPCPMPGTRPSTWTKAKGWLTQPISETCVALSATVEEDIQGLHELQSRNGRLLWRGLISGLVATPIGGVAFALSRFISWLAA